MVLLYVVIPRNIRDGEDDATPPCAVALPSPKGLSIPHKCAKLSNMLANQPPCHWSIRELRSLSFRDKRLVRKAISLLQRVSQHPELPISRLSKSKAEQDSFYRFIGNKKTTFKSILDAHQNETIDRMSRSPGKILLIEDTSKIETLHLEDYEVGPISAGNKKGFMLHATLAVDTDKFQLLGIASSLLWNRSDIKKPENETGKDRKKRVRESAKWAIPPLDLMKKSKNTEIGDKEFIIVADREADIYEIYIFYQAIKHGFVIRAAQPRKIKGEKSNNFKTLDASPVRFYYKKTIPRNGDRPEDVVMLSVRAMKIEILAPMNIDRKGDSVTVNMLSIKEEGTTICEPLCWYLVTSEPIETQKDIEAVIKMYETRWLIEEFFKGLKTGCKIEERQFESRKSTEAFLGIAMIATWKILQLKWLAKSDLAILDSMDNIEINLINKMRNKNLTRNSKAREVIRLIASIGGFNIHKKEEPGWQSIWYGWKKIQSHYESLQLFDFSDDFKM
jgi:Transposase DNA-binding/Transposase DDE domain